MSSHNPRVDLSVIDTSGDDTFGSFNPFFQRPCLSRSGAYRVYSPTVQHVLIHEAKIARGHYGYNHDVSIAWFNGLFYAAWNAHGRTHLEGDAGQVNVLATSKDFRTWSTPVEFLHDESENPILSPQGVMWQPNLLNYNNEALWCFWCLCHPLEKSAELEHSGTYLSVLSRKPGAKWVNRKIIDRHIIDGRSTIGFPSQNPYRCKSGRVLVPVTFIDSSEQAEDERNNYHYNACLYSDDDGRTWQVSNPISQIGEKSAQWEPFFYEQQDGTLRAVMRNFTAGTPHPTHWQLTSVGSGSQKGQPVLFNPDPDFSPIETANTRTQIFKTSASRYCMLHHDLFLHHGVGQWTWNPHRDYHSRLNIALFFSRSGADDFVASVPLSRRNVVSTYPQGIEHDGKIYVAYTIGAGDECRSIEGVMIDPAPDDDKYYIWLREKDDVRMRVEYHESGRREVARDNPDQRAGKAELIDYEGRTGLYFKDRISAGVDTDAVYFEKGRELYFTFQVNVLRLQTCGILVLCSMGDRMPIRIGVGANRREMLYAYCRQGWRPVGAFRQGRWETLEILYGKDHFSVSVNGQTAKTLDNPLVLPNPRLYLGDGFESDYLPNNIGSEFVVDMASIQSAIIDAHSDVTCEEGRT